MSPEIIAFLSDQWWLVAIAVALMGWLIADITIGSIQKSRYLGVDEAAQRAAREKVLFVDLRANNAYANSHLIHAIHAERDTLVKTLQQRTPKPDIVILYADKYKNLAKIAAKTEQATGLHIFWLKGGFDTWVAENYPTGRKR